MGHDKENVAVHDEEKVVGHDEENVAVHDEEKVMVHDEEKAVVHDEENVAVHDEEKMVVHDATHDDQNTLQAVHVVQMVVTYVVVSHASKNEHYVVP